MTAHGEDDAVGGPGTPVHGGYAARAGEADWAKVLNEIDALPAEMPAQVFLV
jgi:hypothetical protein